MSTSNLLAFLEKLDGELKKSSDVYRSLTANKLQHTLTIKKSTLFKVLNTLFNRSTNLGNSMDDTRQSSILKTYKNSISDEIDTFINNIRQDFNELKEKNPESIIFRKGSRSGDSISVVLLTNTNTRGQGRDNFELAKSIYRNHLQNFYNNLLKLLDVKYIEREGSKGKLYQLTEAKDVFNLEHQGKSNSNVKAFINDSINTAFEEFYTPDDKAALSNDLKKLGLKSFLEIEKNNKTESIRVFLGSQILNNIESSKEQALKRNLQAKLAEALDKLRVEEIKGSDSLATNAYKIRKKKVLQPYKTIRSKKIKKNIEDVKLDNKLSKKSLDTSGKVLKGPPVSAKIATKNLYKESENQRSLFSLISLINAKLPQTVANNMEYPRLQNRTGRFAQSVLVTDVIQTARGFPSFGYTYQRNPYQVFEVGSGKAPWATQDRDPRSLIDKSIREIAAEMAIGRFYTRRV